MQEHGSVGRVSPDPSPQLTHLDSLPSPMAVLCPKWPGTQAREHPSPHAHLAYSYHSVTHLGVHMGVCCTLKRMDPGKVLV